MLTRSRRRSTGLVVLAASFCSIAACSLFTDLDGLDDKEKVVVTTAPEDAGKDAGTSTDGGLDGRFCERGTHAFCADFEESDALAVWTQTVEEGTVSVVSTNGTRTLHATQNARPMMPESQYSLASKAIYGPWRHIVVELDMLVEKQDWKPDQKDSAVFGIQFKSDSADQSIYLTVARTDLYVGASNLINVHGSQIANDIWMHVKLDIDPAGSLTATIGDQHLGPAPFTPLSSGMNPSIEIAAGIQGFNSPVPAYSVYYDNVAVDFVP